MGILQVEFPAQGQKFPPPGVKNSHLWGGDLHFWGRNCHSGGENSNFWDQNLSPRGKKFYFGDKFVISGVEIAPRSRNSDLWGGNFPL